MVQSTDPTVVQNENAPLPTGKPPKPPRPFAEPVYVARPLLPPLPEFADRLAEVWDTRWLTNNGAQHQALERALARHLGAMHLSLFANGTLALLTACHVLKLTGRAIVTPFTFPATVHALTWAGLTPVFADVDTGTMTLDPDSAMAAIDGDTSAIVGVHVYGMPCAVDRFPALAASRGVKLIYDAAHAFGTTVDDVPIARFGDATMYSFHATKLFHTAEGGALAVRDEATKRQVDLAKNFGIANEFEVTGTGINAKMSELSAALGMSVLPHLAAERVARGRVVAAYDAGLAQAIGVRAVRPRAGVSDALQYYVIRVDADAAPCARDDLHARLKRFNVHARKYFFPLASDYPAYRGLPGAAPENLPNAHRAADEVLCLPLYGSLGPEGAERICAMIAYALHHP